jgi:glycerol-3-phosphate acyltransferase PlsX
MIHVVVDAAGGDHGIEPNVEAAVEAVSNWPEVEISLVGPADQIQPLLESAKAACGRLHVVEAPEQVLMTDPAIAPLRQKRNSSISVGLQMLRDGRAGAFVSAGNTGAVMAASKVLLGCIEGVDRPTLATPLPNVKGVSVLLDVGANVDCKAHHLRQFAVMGSIYAQVLGIAEPRVALLSIGEEASKGNDLIRSVHAVLKRSPLNFIGNIDGKDIFSGEADVVVCDGFTGNVVLKSAESLADSIFRVMRKEIEERPAARLGYLLCRGAFGSVKRRLDYAEYGGAPLLGVKGTVVICHGRSGAKAIRNAVRVALECAKLRLTERIRSDIERLTAMEEAYGGDGNGQPAEAGSSGENSSRRSGSA